MTDFVCFDCGQTKPRQTDGGTGYATFTDVMAQVPVCYACCALRDAEYMKRNARITLYFMYKDKGMVTNWPGTLQFNARNVRRFNHPFAREAYLGEFTGPDGKLWRFKNIGDSEIAHCRRAKS